MSDYEDYDVDYEDTDADPEPDAWYRKHQYHIVRWAGVLCLREFTVVGVKYPGQDWGEADFWEEGLRERKIDELPEHWRPHIEELGANLPDGAGQSVQVNPNDWDD